MAPATCAHCDLPVPHHRRRRTAGSAEFCCFGCRLAHELSQPGALPGAGNSLGLDGTLILRLGIGIFLAMNIMVFNWLFYSRELFGEVVSGSGYAAVSGLFSYLLMFLATLVVVLLGLPLMADAVRTLLGSGGRIETNLLIGIGVGAAYLVSVIHTIRGQGSLYYDTAAMVLVLVTLGSYLEAGAKRRAATAARGLLAEIPQQVWVRRGGDVVEIDCEQSRSGDQVRARPGEAIAVDGRVVEGASRVDGSSLTGESRLREVAVGDPVLAGSINLEGQLWIEADEVGAGRVIARMQRLLEQARAAAPPIQRLSDRIAAVFVPLVVLLAVLVFAWQASSADLAGGLLRALSVLLISCPCALGLAAPLASWQALRRAAGRGILFDSAVTLEQAASIDHVAFDKTGTLTDRLPLLSAVVPADGLDGDEILELAAALESASLHPVGRALVAAAQLRDLAVRQPTDAVTHAGLGIEARVDGRLLFLGGERFLRARGHQASPDAAEQTVVFLFDDESVLGRFDLDERLRPDALTAIDELRALGVSARILSGDRAVPTARVGRLLGLPVAAELLPEDKVELLRQVSGAVAMVGDGINDAPVLAAADVGITVGGATDLAQRAGGVRLVSDRLTGVPLALGIARDCRRRIRLGLGWTFGYNTIGIGLASLGLLSPIFSASAMVISSLVVVAISSGSGRFAESAHSANGMPTATDLERQAA